MKHPLLRSDLTGTASCRYGAIVHHHDGDACRANSVSDGTVFCVFCGRRGPSTFDALLNSNGGRLQPVQNDNPHLYMYTVKVSHRAWATLSFEDPKLFDDSLEFGADFGEDYVSPPAEAKLPQEVDNIAKALANVGFRVTGDRASNVSGSLIMILGRRLFPGDPNRPAVQGVRVEITWSY